MYKRGTFQVNLGKEFVRQIPEKKLHNINYHCFQTAITQHLLSLLRVLIHPLPFAVDSIMLSAMGRLRTGAMLDMLIPGRMTKAAGSLQFHGTSLHYGKKPANYRRAAYSGILLAQSPLRHFQVLAEQAIFFHFRFNY